MEMESGTSPAAAASRVGCWVFLPRKLSASCLGYRPLGLDDDDGGLWRPSASPAAVTVVVGKERRVFVVDPFVLEEEPFRILMGMTGDARRPRRLMGSRSRKGEASKDVVFLDVDAILFEHLLWLVDRRDDGESLLRINLREIIDFYAQDC